MHYVDTSRRAELRPQAESPGRADRSVILCGIICTGPGSARAMEQPNRRSAVLVRSVMGLERWVKALPNPESVRPGRCPSCGAASQPVGQPVVRHGHGLRGRQVRGPLSGHSPSLLRWSPGEAWAVTRLVRHLTATVASALPSKLPVQVITTAWVNSDTLPSHFD